ncbi:TetR/AcrR family transcriptional regulator [Silvibacterium dinghuense]|uniref:TetR/AcrR family transcriptional regulator n=1 Tax=Silvibacterium dinghuense TaxID=1560006 RepID=A0A4Q1S9D5_9BACT|nr:TetR/AcrR family transcriptional regulator [Silvibacterium dinghuense]RXS93676.1 TetR/AcrR family transcriptional regulator [Silvibacterium dinghuense]GGH06693.1 TetR family transcriptional regulator [Silvibacterium dinghuense]
MAQRGRPKCFDPAAALDAAVLLFWERGFEQTSVDEVAAAMNLCTSSLYSSFGDKETLFLAAVNHYLAGRGEVYREAVREGKTAREGFAKLFEVSANELTRTDQPRGCLLWLALPTCSPKYEKLQDEMNRLRASSEAGWLKRLREAVRLKELPKNTDIDLLASYFRTTLSGMSLQARSGATKEQLMKIGQLALAIWPKPSRKPAQKTMTTASKNR